MLGVLALGVAFVMAARGVARGMRVVAAVGVGALVWAWAVAQYPYLLPFRLTISEGAGSSTSMKWLLAWFLVALVTVIPLLIVLYTLDQRGHLGEDPRTSRMEAPGVGEVAAAATAAESGRESRPAGIRESTADREASSSRDAAEENQRRTGRHRAQPPGGNSRRSD